MVQFGLRPCLEDFFLCVNCLALLANWNEKSIKLTDSIRILLTKDNRTSAKVADCVKVKHMLEFGAY